MEFNGFTLIIGLTVFIIAFSYQLASAEQVILLDTIQDNWRGWSTNSGKFSGWRSQNIPPNGDKVFGVCMIHLEHNDNWLFSPIVPIGEAYSVNIETYFSMRSCRNHPVPNEIKNCEESISLYIQETDRILDDMNNDKEKINIRYFTEKALLFSKSKWSTENLVRSDDQLSLNQLTIRATFAGLRLGYRDTGSCTMLRRVRIVYVACPESVSRFTKFPRTVSKDKFQVVNVKGQCVTGAQLKKPVSGDTLTRFCHSDGRWHDMAGQSCHCSPGFTASSDEKKCLPCAKGTYKQFSGPGKCQYCPLNSHTKVGKSTCQCNLGYYKKEFKLDDVKTILCLKLPLPPRNLKANVTDGSRVILLWTYPGGSIESQHDSVLYFHIACRVCQSEGVLFVPGINITQTNVTIYGLEFGQKYQFFVTSISSLSLTYKNVSFKPSQSSIHFSLPHTSSSRIKAVRINRLINSTIVISWSAPNIPNNLSVELYMLQIVMKSLRNSTTNSQYLYRFCKIHRYMFTPLSLVVNVRVKVRFKQNEIWSEYSLSAENQYSNNLNHHKLNDNKSQLSFGKSIFVLFPNLETILMLIASAVLVLIILSVTILLMRRFLFASLKRNAQYKTGIVTLTENTKSSYASITTNSIPSRARSYFYLQSVESLSGPTVIVPGGTFPGTLHSSASLGAINCNSTFATSATFTDIPSDMIIVNDLKKPGKYMDLFDGGLRQTRRLPVRATVCLIKTNMPEQARNDLLARFQTAARLRHDNLLNVLGFGTYLNDRSAILLDYTPNGVLHTFLKIHHSKLTNGRLLQFSREIASAMLYLSGLQMVHNNLSTQCVYLDELMVCKLSLYPIETSNEVEENCQIEETNNSDRSHWLAPELLNSDSQPTNASDVWAFGIVLWEIFSCGIIAPYPANWDRNTLKVKISTGYQPPVQSLIRLENAIFSTTGTVASLMRSCWILDAPLRPTFGHIISKLDSIANYMLDDVADVRPNIQSNFEGISDSNNLISNQVQESELLNPSTRNAIQTLDRQRIQSLSSKQSRNRSLDNVRCTKINNQHQNNSMILIHHSPLTQKIINNHNNNNNNNNNNNDDNNLTNKTFSLHTWLSTLNLRKYKTVLSQRGYDDCHKMAHISIADLTQMGIKNASDIQIIIQNAQQLKNQL